MGRLSIVLGPVFTSFALKLSMCHFTLARLGFVVFLVQSLGVQWNDSSLRARKHRSPSRSHFCVPVCTALLPGATHARSCGAVLIAACGLVLFIMRTRMFWV